VDPIVTVSVAEYRSRPITVIGAVKNPLTFQATGKVTLLGCDLASWRSDGGSRLRDPGDPREHVGRQQLVATDYSRSSSRLD